MLLRNFLIYLINSLELSYEDTHYMVGYLDGLSICDSDVTLDSFGNPFFIKLFELSVKNEKLIEGKDFFKNA